MRILFAVFINNLSRHLFNLMQTFMHNTKFTEDQNISLVQNAIHDLIQVLDGMDHPSVIMKGKCFRTKACLFKCREKNCFFKAKLVRKIGVMLGYSRLHFGIREFDTDIPYGRQFCVNWCWQQLKIRPIFDYLQKRQMSKQKEIHSGSFLLIKTFNTNLIDYVNARDKQVTSLKNLQKNHWRIKCSSYNVS